MQEAHLRLSHAAVVPSPDGRSSMAYVQFIQQHESLDVENSYANFSVKLLRDRSLLVSAEARLYPELTLPPAARRLGAKAEVEAAEALGLEPAKAKPKETRRLLRYIDGQWRRVEEVRFEESEWTGVVDADTGESWVQDDRVFAEVHGRVRGRGVRFNPIATGQNLETLNLPALQLATTSGATSHTDAVGHFVFPNETNTTSVMAALLGRRAKVRSNTSSNLTLSGLATPGGTLRPAV